VGVYNSYQTPFGGKSNGGAVYNLGKLSTPYQTTNLVVGGNGSTVLNDGVWHHLVTTFNRTTKKVNWYVDGSLDRAEGTYPSWVTHFSIAIGSDYGSSGYYFFNGTVDECSHWQKVLTQSEVTNLYNGGVPTDLTSLSPYGWWRNGDGDTYPTIIDHGSGGNDGTMTNMVASSIVTDTP
jgi:hypothetical protein